MSEKDEPTLANQESELASYMGRLLRDHFGKGPESVYVSLGKDIITVYLKNFMSPMEKVLMDRDEEKTVQETRDMLMQTLIPEIKAYAKIVSGLEIDEFYYDWGLHNQSGLFAGITSETCESWQESYPGKENIHKEIQRISQQVEKKPADIDSAFLNPRTLVVIRKEILVRIEKELIRLGYGETLKIAKRNLEKTYLHNNHFESILHAQVTDVFVDWGFQSNKSVIVIILKPTE